jgi:fucose 4-O-acetylase-like acetyltransferase
MVFSDGKSFSILMYSKIRTLLVPYYFFGIFVTLALYLHNNISTTSQIYDFVVFGTGYNSALWFIAHLFVLTLYSQFLIKFLNKTALYIFLVLHLIIGLKFLEIDIPSFWRLDLLPLSFSFFIAGYLFKNRIIDIITSLKCWMVAATLAIFLASVYLNLLYHHFDSQSYGQFLDLPLNYLVACISGILLTLFISSRLIKFRFLHFIGQYTIVILSTHQFIPMLLIAFYALINIDMPSILHRILSVALIYCLIIFIDKYARFVVGKGNS